VLGAFLVLFWKTKIRFAYMFFAGLRWFHGTFEAPAFLMLPLWFASELFQAWLFDSIGGGSSIAYWAHVGGFVFGAGVALGISALKIEERFIHPGIESKVTLMEANPVIEQAMKAQEEDDLERAHAMLEKEAKRCPEDHDLAQAFWDNAVLLQRAESAAPAMLNSIRRAAARENLQLAADQWGELSQALPGSLADPGSLIRIVPVLLERKQPEKAVLALRQAVDPNNRGMTAGLALRIVEQAREVDPPSALQAARRALEFEDVHETRRAQLQELIQELEASSQKIPKPSGPAAAEAGPQPFPDDESIPLEGEAGEAARVTSATAAVEAAVATAPTLRALGAEGTLSAHEGDGQLAPESPDIAPEFGAEPDQADRAQFGFEPGADLGLDPSMPLVGAVAALQKPAPDTAAPGSHPPPLPAAPLSLPPLNAASATPPPLPNPAQPATAGSSDLAENDNLDVVDAELIEDSDLLALADLPRFGGVKAVEGVPFELKREGVSLNLDGGRKALIEYEKVQAIAVAAVGGLGPSPVLLIDLALNWNQASGTHLQVVRIRSDRFDPRALFSEAETPMEATRMLLSQLIGSTDAVLLPDPKAAHARPISSFDELSEYERRVLQSAG
jgi:hypothetical protein